MDKRAWMRMTLLVLCGVAALAIGSNPRYLEELRIGGGYGDAIDGGADLEKDGDLFTDGSVQPSELALGDGNRVVFGDGGEFEVGLDPGTNELRVTDGTNPLVRVLDQGATGDLAVSGWLLRGTACAGLSGEGLAALWHCEDATEFADYSGGGETMTVGGSGTVTGAGKYGTCLVFDGNGYADNATPALADSLTDDVTFALWVKTTSTAFQDLLGWQPSGADRLKLILNLGKVIWQEVHWNGTGYDVNNCLGVTNIADGEWHHIVCTRDRGGTNSIYVDGVQDGTHASNGYDLSEAATLRLGGRDPYDPAAKFVGAVDEVSIWRRALSAGEVKALYQAPAELADAYGGQAIDGNLLVEDVEATGDVTALGGDGVFGTDGAVRGALTLWDGVGATPGCVTLVSADGTPWRLFAANDGRLRVVDSMPSSDGDGWRAGLGAIWLPAKAGAPSGTAGAGAPVAQHYGTSQLSCYRIPFDPDTEEYAFWNLVLPPDYGGQDVAVRVYWTAASGTAGTFVDWVVQGRALADGENLNAPASWGSGVNLVDTYAGVDHLAVAAGAAGLSLEGSPEAGEFVALRLMRDGDDGVNDTLAADASAIAVELRY